MKPDYRGLIASIFAGGIVLWGLLAIGGGVFSGRPLAEQGAEVFSALGGAMVTAVVTYLTVKRNGNGDK